MDRQVQLQNRIEQLQQKDKTPRPQRKVFLPQLNPAKSAMLNTRDVGRRNQGDRSDPDDEEELTSNVDTDAFKQAMWAGQANILVTVRLRPHLSHDRDNQEIVKVLDHKVIVVLDAASDLAAATQTSPARRHTSFPARKVRNVTAPAAAQRRSREKRFAFDYVFTPEDGQQTVYSHTTKFLIHGVLNGFNATVFVYGNTGAGKTYTMLGTPDEPGIMALTLEDLFQNIQRVHADIQSNVTYRVTVSFLEVYNENIRDLLANQSASTASPGTPSEYLDLREDPIKGPIVAGISEIEACNASEVMKLLRKGNKHRSQEATAANAVSSRSHAVLQVLVEQREKTSASHITSENSDDESSSGKGGGESITTVVKFGKLSLVDLAGSERAAVTQNRGQRLLEGANINRSLLALGNCINALGEKGASTASFVPYRDSKLTRLLKDSLGGNCRTVMIANISLAKASLEETLNTLKYANRAKNIKTTMTRNVLNVDHHITEYFGSMMRLLKVQVRELQGS
uniref:Kinesin-like protein n=1 Tax=Globisporangium ultimum (strain ATCC 200006 / CBS 805.95 / DAOM BR144) TaxID=431595 RepID=K3WAL3_GLOUD